MDDNNDVKNGHLGKIAPAKLISHHFKLNEILKTHEVFGSAAIKSDENNLISE
jgi:hypothetical protein